MIPRLQKEVIQKQIKESKLLLIRGPRNVGKLDLVEQVLNEEGLAHITFDCSDKKIRTNIRDRINESQNASVIVLNQAEFVEELQQIVEATFSGKIKSTLIILCSFHPQLDDELIEAMRIEGLDVSFFAPSFYEAAQHFGLPKEEQLLEERLIYGNYPDVLHDLENAEITLRELVHDVMHTKLGVQDRINKGDKMLRMMQLLAFEIGEPVSYNDIGERCGLDNETVERYIELLEDAFILIKLPSYHTEQRYELKKSHCIYFLDNGIRNVLISNFNPTFLRNDMDELWRNYLIAERIKWIRMNNLSLTPFFWRTHTRQQLDYVESGDSMRAYKTDWFKRKKVKIPAMFTELYPHAKANVLNRSSYWPFLSSKK
jgi:predicted AAA+ superfamily ATPase